MSEVVNAEVVSQKAPRNANVSDEAIITAWEKMAVRKDVEGKLNGSVQECSDELKMKKASLIQRVQSLKSIITLTKMPRQPHTGSGGKRKDPQTVKDLLAKIRADLAATL